MRLLTASLLLLAARGHILAQGALATQGFGYAPGQLSARAAATGGALAEFDPTSSVNPGAVGAWSGRSGIFFQYSPEFRRTRTAGGDDKATIARFPLVGGILRIGERWTAAASASTFLDRSWETTFTGTDTLGGDVAPFTASTRSVGAINDFRIAAAWAPFARLRLGLAGHVFAGENRRQEDRLYSDSSVFAPFRSRSSVSFSGRAVSVGVEVQPSPDFALAASARAGGTIKAFSGDTTLTEAEIPARIGFGAAYSGVAGTVLGVSAERTRWTSLESLAESNITAHDAWDIGVGAETKGPQLAGATIPVRAGYRWRTLPFGIGANEISEKIIAGGLGVQFARNRATADLTVERASRTGSTGSGSASEKAWTLSVGFTVRP
ncbi:MAG: hypothetical protein ABR543_19185 [Gemmatimonadaceae bacterium]